MAHAQPGERWIGICTMLVQMLGADVYRPAQWHDFFMTVGDAAAARAPREWAIPAATASTLVRPASRLGKHMEVLES